MRGYLLRVKSSASNLIDILLTSSFVSNFILRCRFMSLFLHPNRESLANGMFLIEYILNASYQLLTIRPLFQVVKYQESEYFQRP